MLVKNGFDRKSQQTSENKKQNNFNLEEIKSQIDDISLNFLQRLDGLIFVEKGLDKNTIRHLMNLKLIKNEIFPLEPPNKIVVTYGYYLTDTGRSLIKKLNIGRLYPKIFCDLLRVRYWEGNQNDFSTKKNEFRDEYGLSWDECWRLFVLQLEKINPKSKADPLGVLNSFLSENAFDIVQDRFVVPWLRTLGRGKDLT